MDKIENAVNELKKGIIGYVKNYMNNAGYDKTVVGIVKSVNGTKSTVVINQIEYSNIPKLDYVTVTENDIVKVVIPQNNYSNMFILGKLG